MAGPRWQGSSAQPPQTLAKRTSVTQSFGHRERVAVRGTKTTQERVVNGCTLLRNSIGARGRGHRGRSDPRISCIRARSQRTLRPARQALHISARPHPDRKSAGAGGRYATQAQHSHQGPEGCTAGCSRSVQIVCCGCLTGAAQRGRRGKLSVVKVLDTVSHFADCRGHGSVWAFPNKLRLAIGSSIFEWFC